MTCGYTQKEAKRLAYKFNRVIDEHQLIKVPMINFLDISFYQFTKNGKTKTFLCEERLNHKKFIKWNDNKGGVLNLQ